MNGRKVPVSEMPALEEPRLGSFARRALKKIGFLSVAEKIATSRAISESEIARLVDQAGIPVLIKLVKIARERSKPILDSSQLGVSQDFYKVGRNLNDLITPAWISEIKNRGVNRVELPLQSGAVSSLTEAGIQVDLVSDFDRIITHEDIVAEFVKLSSLMNASGRVKSWMPVLTPASGQYQEAAARDFQLLRLVGIARIVCGDRISIRIARSLLSVDARPYAALAGSTDVVNYSPVDPVDGEIFIRTFSLQKTGENSFL
jgi:hypothetical protein